MDTLEKGLGNINRCSAPSDLRITDIRIAKIQGAPMDCIMVKILTNSELVGYGEIRDWSSETYGLMLKSRLIGENPCNIDKIFRRIKQFGGHSRQGGGVSGIELALWDLAGKAYGVPVYQMLGGKFRDKVRVYADTDCEGKPDGKKMGEALKKRLDLGFTFLKMDWGAPELLEMEIPGTLCAPLGFVGELRELEPYTNDSREENRHLYKKAWDIVNTAHPFTGLQITEKGLDVLEQYVSDVRSVIGYDVPLAIDHVGHIGVTECIKLAKRAEKYNIAWIEDMLPWQMTEGYKRLAAATCVPLCTGEDIYLKEGFRSLIEGGCVSVIHPDILTCGGARELKKIADIADENGVAVAIHMAESPVACMAAVHAAAAMRNVLAMELHSVDVPWWQDIAIGLEKPLVRDGFINVPDRPGLGLEGLDDDVIRMHINKDIPGIWEPTDEWDTEFANDRIWS